MEADYGNLSLAYQVTPSLARPGPFSRYFNESSTGVSTESLPVKTIKFLLYAAVFVVGLGGNAIVIWIMIKKKKARNFHNLLLGNLAAADIALLSINLPFRLIYQENNYVWPFGRFLCKVIPMFTYLFLTTSSLTLVAISYERHRTISSLVVKCKPVTRCDWFSVGLIWFISCITTLPLNIFLDIVMRKDGKPVCTDIWPSATLEKSYFFFLFVIQFLLPSVIMGVMYIRVWLLLRRSRYKLKDFGLTTLAKRQRKTVRMICTIVVVYIVLTLPYHITWQLRNFGIQSALAKKFSVLFLTATSASHPIIYGALHQEFSLGLKAFLRGSKKARKDFLKTSIKLTSPRAGNHPHRGSDFETCNEDSVEFVQHISVM